MTTRPSPAPGVETDPPAPLRDVLPTAPLHGVLSASVAYAFSDRRTGTMSASVGEGDHRHHRDVLAGSVGLTADRIAWMRQVHGGEVVTTHSPVGPPPTGDGIVTDRPELGLGVVVADCVPVLMATPSAVAAAHAGRPGVLAGVVPATVRRLCEISGDTPREVQVVIGPAIGPCCYEVPAAMAADVDARVPGTRSTTTWGTPSLDLLAGVTGQLRAAGVDAVARAGGCTRCDQPGRWFSHRASGNEGRPAGRQAGIIVRGRGGAR